jgi:zinc transport system permease protein
MFTEPYMQRALVAAVLLGPLCALLGVFVTARRMSFFSDTIAHGALTGVALGVWFGMADLTIPMVLVGLMVAAAIIWLTENTDLLTDTIMAILLSGSVATGIILLNTLKGGRSVIHSYMFGDILAIDTPEVIAAALLFLVVVIGTFSQLSSLTLITAHEEMARVTGIRVRLLNYLFILVLTFTVALSIRLLGIILVTSLLVIPPAAARNLSRNLRQHLVLSIVVGLACGLLGLYFSYRLNVPCGPSIVLSCIGFFLLTLVVSKLRNLSRIHEQGIKTAAL